MLDERLSAIHAAFAFCLGLVVPAVLGWFQTATGISPAAALLGLAQHLADHRGDAVVESGAGRMLRAYGSFSHPNVFGGFLAVSLVLTAWLWERWRGKHRPVLFSFAIIFSATLVITFSRSAWLAVGVSALVGAALMLWFRKRLPREAIPMLAGSLFVILITSAVFVQPLFARFDPSERLEAISIAERAGQYTTVHEVILRNPITGVGFGAYTAALAKEFPGGPSWSYQPIHNAFLLVLSEIGVLGFLAMLLWTLSVDRFHLRALHLRGGIFAASIGAILLVVALFDHYLWSSWQGLALAAFVLSLTIRLTDPTAKPQV
jgi:O-antigen ligase